MEGGFSFKVGGVSSLGWVAVVGLLGCTPRAAPVNAPPEAFAPSRVAPVAPPTTEAAADDTSPKSAEDAAAAAGEASRAEPAPPPVPQFFEGQERVTYGEFILELRKIADTLAEDPDVRAAHEALLTEKQLTEEELPLESFSRVRLAFESARDSGLWGIRGTVTDQMPWSDRIWEQWGARSFTPEAPVAVSESSVASEAPVFPTAVGECDELGALFSILARDLGVIGFVGLHWPYWNHVVPVWQVSKKDGTFVRIVVPATQTFLDKKDTIGTTGLPTNRVVFPYVRKDRRNEAEISADLARYLLTQSQLHGGMSTAELTQRRLWHRWNNRPGAAEQEIKKTPQPGASSATSQSATVSQK